MASVVRLILVCPVAFEWSSWIVRVMRVAALLSLLLLASPAFLTAQSTTLYSIGEPTDEEQLYLELINRARANPTQEGIRMAASTHPDVLLALTQFNVDLIMMKAEFAALPVRPPLAMNATLTTMARAHTQDMFTNAFQGHVGSNGSTLATRVQAVQYPVSTAGENVFSRARDVVHSHAGFQIDWGNDGGAGGMQLGRGHRVNIHGDFREVGVGVKLGSNTVGNSEVGPHLVTQNFGTQTDSKAYITGVAYYDVNGNGFYDLGEGIGGLNVNVQGAEHHAVTASSGGYAIPVPTSNATRSVNFSGLGFNSSFNAVIANGANVKVDLKPAYVAPTPSGSVIVKTGEASTYTFAALHGATGYEWQSVLFQPAVADPAENLNRVTTSTTGTYQPLSTAVKFAGSSAYRLTHTTDRTSSELLTYKDTFLVKPGAQLQFRSRLQIAMVNQVARVQISTDNGVNWTDIYSQAGSTPVGSPSDPGESSFSLRTISLANYAGQQIRLRFNYDFQGGSYFRGTDNHFGWSVDDVQFNQLSTVTDSRVTSVAEGQTQFSFAPPAEGEYALSVRPTISGRAWGYGPTLAVKAENSPPQPVDITVGIPANSSFTSGAGILSFGGVNLEGNVVRTVTITNSGTEPLTDIELAVEGTHASEFTTTELTAATLASGASQTVDVTFSPTAQGTRTAVLKIYSNDPDESPFSLTLNGEGLVGLGFLSTPQPKVVRLGAEAVLTAEANITGATYQWKKNNANIRGATSREFRIAQTKTGDAGLYRVEIKGGEPQATLLSDAVPLGLVEDIERTVSAREGKPATVSLSVKAYGPELSYEWKTSASAEAFAGNTTKLTKTLIVPTSQSSIYSGTYYCEVKARSSLPQRGATTNLIINSGAPEVMEDQALPPAIVGGEFSHKIRVSESPTRVPLSYSTRGLPAGLKLDPKTGIISGRPTKKGEYTVTFSASNQAGFGSMQITFSVADFPLNLAGNYMGLVDRDQALNQNMGGRLDLKVTGLGAYTGSLTLGTAKVAFKGSLAIDASGAVLPYLDLLLQPPGKPLPGKMRLLVNINNSANKLAESSLSRGEEVASIRGWRQVYDGRTTVATPYLGLHTFGLMPSSAIENQGLPQGSGFGSFTPGRDGKVNIAGRTGDGEKFTHASWVGPTGEVLFYQPLYTTAIKGSLHGGIEIGVGDVQNDASDNTLLGALTWNRPANAKSRLYPEGFGLPGTPVEEPVAITVRGGAYKAPVGRDGVIMEMEVGDEVSLDLHQSSLDIHEIPLQLGAKNAFTPIVPEEAPVGFKLSANAKTGAVTGGFTLPGNPKRQVTLTGQLILSNGVHSAVGFFLLPELPEGNTPANATRIFSGRMTVSRPN